jgi:hypothetical protein
VSGAANQLAHYNQFTAALAKAASVDEVKAIHDQAAAMKAAAKILNDREAVADMAVIRARAERRLGEMLEVGKADRAGRGKPKNVSEKRLLLPTLKELGIDNNLAHRARRAAALSQEAFYALIAEGRESIVEGTFYNSINYPESEAEVAERKAERKRARAIGKKRRAEYKAELERTRPEREAELAEHQARLAAKEAGEPDGEVAAPIAPAAPVIPAPAPGPLPTRALAEFKVACRTWLPKLSGEDLDAAIAYASTFARVPEVAA